MNKLEEYMSVNISKSGFKDMPDAIIGYKKLVELKDSDAMNNLGKIYRYHDEYKNISESIRYFKMAVELKKCGFNE